MPYVSGYLEIMAAPGYPDNTLPGIPGRPTHPIYLPPYPSQGPGFPTHPIAPGGPPLYPSNALPGIPGYPSHPIYLPPYPSQGPGLPPYPSQGLPPYPSPPIFIPVPPGEKPDPGDGLHPAHPIVIPPPEGSEHGQSYLVHTTVPGTNQGVWLIVTVPLQPSTLPVPPPSQAQPKSRGILG